MEEKEKLVYSVEELTNVLNISKSTAYQLVRSSNFPKIKIGKRILIPANKLKEWISEQVSEL